MTWVDILTGRGVFMRVIASIRIVAVRNIRKIHPLNIWIEYRITYINVYNLYKNIQLIIIIALCFFIFSTKINKYFADK